MTINPRDYDLDELRKMARQDGPPDGARDGASAEPQRDSTDGRDRRPGPIGGADADGGPLADLGAGDSAARGDLYRELLPFLNDPAEKPYLGTLPQTYAAELVIFEWLEYLTGRAGYHGTVDALDYYADLEWVTDDVRSTLSDYLLGIDEGSTGEGDLDVDEHMRSLVYVAKLSAMD